MRLVFTLSLSSRSSPSFLLCCWHYQAHQSGGDLIQGENEIYAPGVNGGVGHAERHGRELILGNHLTAHFVDRQHPFSTITVPAGKNYADPPAL